MNVRIAKLKIESKALEASVASLKAVAGTIDNAEFQRRRAYLRERLRACHLGIAYLRGIPYQAVEPYTPIYSGGAPPIYRTWDTLGRVPGEGQQIRAWVKTTAYGPWPHWSLSRKQQVRVARLCHPYVDINDVLALVEQLRAEGYVPEELRPGGFDPIGKAGFAT